MVTPTLYRGGQPTADHLRKLHQLGVTKIVDLRRERLDVRRAERATARELGIEFVELPFYGVFGVDPGFLDTVVAELADGNVVYVHCDNGRDRTSLAVALYRVLVEGWDADVSWEREAVAYGHPNKPVYREIELAFREQTLEHGLRKQTIATASTRVNAVTAAMRTRGISLGESPDGELVSLPEERATAPGPEKARPGEGDLVPIMQGVLLMQRPIH